VCFKAALSWAHIIVVIGMVVALPFAFGWISATGAVRVIAHDGMAITIAFATNLRWQSVIRSAICHGDERIGNENMRS